MRSGPEPAFISTCLKATAWASPSLPTRHEQAGVVWYSPAWTSDAGVDYQLASADAALDLVNGQLVEKTHRPALQSGERPFRLSSDYTLFGPDDVA